LEETKIAKVDMDLILNIIVKVDLTEKVALEPSSVGGEGAGKNIPGRRQLA
jgi:hypothetical protein